MFGLTRWSPFGTAFQLHREIDELFGRFFGQTGTQPAAAPGDGSTWWPAVESGTSEGTLWVRVALPGVDPKDVELTVSENVLTIKGQRKAQSETKEENYFLREFAYGAFERSIVLPEGVDPAKVNAKYSNGMLEISVPAPISVAPKRVEIQVEGQRGDQKAIKAV